jgi:hypothetical protein
MTAKRRVEIMTTIPGHQGMSEVAKEFLQNIFELAGKGNIALKCKTAFRYSRTYHVLKSV